MSNNNNKSSRNNKSTTQMKWNQISFIIVNILQLQEILVHMVEIQHQHLAQMSIFYLELHIIKSNLIMAILQNLKSSINFLIIQATTITIIVVMDNNHNNIISKIVMKINKVLTFLDSLINFITALQTYMKLLRWIIISSYIMKRKNYWIFHFQWTGSLKQW